MKKLLLAIALVAFGLMSCTKEKQTYKIEADITSTSSTPIDFWVYGAFGNYEYDGGETDVHTNIQPSQTIHYSSEFIPL